uniref:Uncharacterized protein n=1 Tax=Timema poppense TaxID=170557 RepID=A0A7R9H0J8_TIMPO|nr:unnamed protein product [Timema poppensis]
MYLHLREGRVENPFEETTLSTTEQDSSLGLPVIGSLVYCETSALDHAATEADSENGKVLKYFFGLLFPNPGDVDDCFTDDLIKIHPDDERVRSFTDYVLETYVGVRIGSVMDSDTAQVREFIEKLVEGLLNGRLDNVYVNRLYNHPDCEYRFP